METIKVMEAKKYGFGIVGTGLISHFHAKAIADIENAFLVGAFNHNKQKAESFVQLHGGKAFDQLDEMLCHPGIDIVSICTPSGLHLEPALKSIEAGKHCLIEKPLEVTVAKCNLIADAAKAAGVKVAVVFPSRFYEVNRKLKQALVENRFGDIVIGSAYVKWSRTEEYYKSADWRGTWQYDGGGALMNQGIHSLDLLQWMMGPVESVQAVAANRRHKDIEVEDTIVAVLKFRNGALGTLECTTAAYPGFFKRLEIVGNSGSAVLEENSVLKWQMKDEIPADEVFRNTYSAANVSAGGVADPAAISHYGHRMQIVDLISAIENNSTPLIDAMEGKKSVEIIAAIYKSAETGNKIILNNE